MGNWRNNYFRIVDTLVAKIIEKFRKDIEENGLEVVRFNQVSPDRLVNLVRDYKDKIQEILIIKKI